MSTEDKQLLPAPIQTMQTTLEPDGSTSLQPENPDGLWYCFAGNNTNDKRMPCDAFLLWSPTEGGLVLALKGSNPVGIENLRHALRVQSGSQCLPDLLSFGFHSTPWTQIPGGWPGPEETLLDVVDRLFREHGVEETEHILTLSVPIADATWLNPALNCTSGFTRKPLEGVNTGSGVEDGVK